MKESIAEQHARFDAAPMQPSVRIETARSVHVYWLIEGACKAADWKDMQKGLIAYFGSDASIVDLPRPMRLPFFDHLTFCTETGEYVRKRVELVHFEPQSRYALEQLRTAYPAKTSSDQTMSRSSKTVADANTQFNVYTSDPQRDRELAKELLPYLAQWRCNDRKAWIDVGILLYNTFRWRRRFCALG